MSLLDSNKGILSLNSDDFRIALTQHQTCNSLFRTTEYRMEELTELGTTAELESDLASDDLVSLRLALGSALSGIVAK